jgi:ribokinase
MNREQRGIALVGSSIVDELLPAIEPGQLSYVDAAQFVDTSELKGEEHEFSVGGMALNVGVDLARIGGEYPVTVIGKVGTDHRADLIRTILKENGLSTDHLIVDDHWATSSTQVLNIKMPERGVERIFRHTLGAMGSFSPSEVPLHTLKSHRIAMFGYGLLLPQFDLEDKKTGTRMGQVLEQVQSLGVLTALDFVSPTQDNLFKYDRYRKTISYVDILCINEDQARGLTGLSDSRSACQALVDDLGAGLAVVHCGPQGPNYAYSTTDGMIVQPNFHVAEQDIVGNVGAGDAFSAGLLHALHQKLSLAKALTFAAAAAAISLRSSSATAAMQHEKDIVAYMNHTTLKALP